MKRKKAAALLLALVLFLCAIPTAFATSPQTVRVGYIDYAGFIEQDAGGEFGGYGVAYLEKIARYTGWKYEYYYASWADAMDALAAGKLDLLCTAQYTEERGARFDYAKYSTGIESNVLYARPDDDRFCYNEYEQFQGIRVALLRGSFQNETFAQFAEEHGFSYEAVEYDSDGAMFEALAAGEVDAAATGSLSLQRNVKVLCKFGADPFYFITGKNRPEIMTPLKRALDEIKTSDPYFEASLYRTYYQDGTRADDPMFTAEEKEYLRTAKTVRIGNLQRLYPSSAVDAKTGELYGITEELLGEISRISGLNFELVIMPLGQAPVDFLREGKADLFAGTMYAALLRQSEGVVQTDPYFTGKLVMVGRSGETLDPAGENTIALPAGYEACRRLVEASYPGWQIIEREDTETCMEAVRCGDANLLLQNSYIVRNLLQKPRYSSLQIVPTYTYDEPLCITGNADVDPVLISILNKSIASLSSKTVDQIVMAHTIGHPYELTLDDVVYRYRIPLFFVGLLLVCCILLWVCFSRQRAHTLVLLETKNEQLLEAAAQAQRASRAKSVFLSRMSHELRTPLNAIIGLTTIAEKHTEEPRATDSYLAKISLASHILLDMVNDVLDMSAIESDKLRIARVPFDLKQLLQEIATLYYPQCRQKEIGFELLTDFSEEQLVGDSLRVKQVLMNLLSNAVKFTPEGGHVKLTVTQRTMKQDTVYLEFKVSDDGCGIGKELQPRLFEPFEQESATTAQQHGGSGLGLSITQNLVHLMKGAIRVDSAVEEGTTFTVELPFDLALHKTARQTERLQEIRALILDDERDSCTYTAMVLDRIGISYSCASDGDEALRLLTEAETAGEGYDICFVAWRTHGMDGAAMTRRLRARFDEDRLMIVVSAYDTDEIEPEAEAAGANLLVDKPLFQSTVFNLLMNLSGEGHGRHADPLQPYDFTGRRVLLAEDNALNMEVAAELLGLTGIAVERAENGKKAVELFCAAPAGSYDAILLDIQMPVMDGHEAARAIRSAEHPDAATIPILAMTANAFTEDVSSALEAGMNDHIAKPINTGVLYQTLQKYWKDR